MNDLARRLHDLLHTGAPEPDRIITAGEIAGLAQEGLLLNGGVNHKWGVLCSLSVPCWRQLRSQR